MSWWEWALVVAAVWLVLGLFVAALWAVGRQSHERRGVIRFDTPHGRSALRRCNPARDVHYFGGQARCECGEVVYGELPPRVMRTVEGVPTWTLEDVPTVPRVTDTRGRPIE